MTYLIKDRTFLSVEGEGLIRQIQDRDKKIEKLECKLKDMRAVFEEHLQKHKQISIPLLQLDNTVRIP